MKIKALEKSRYQKRLEEEIELFAKRHKVDYEIIEAFAFWIEWRTRQDEKEEIIKIINK